MTDDKIALRTLLEKGSDATFLREMIGFAAERLMQLETDTLCGAGHGERNAERRNQRNGYRDRDWGTRAGYGRAAHSQAAAPPLLPGLPRTSPPGREGADRGGPGSLRPGHLDPLGRRSGAGHGDGGHLQEPGIATMRRDRRAGACLPQSPDRG